MKNYKIVLVSLFVLVMLAGSAQLMARGAERRGMGAGYCDPGCTMHGMGKAGYGLDLTEEQMDKLHALKIEHEKKMIDLKAEMKKLELGMKEEMMKDSPSKNDMMKHVDKMMELKGKAKRAKLEMIFDAKKIMPDDKWKMFVRHHMMKEKYGRGERMGCCSGMGMKGHSGCGGRGEMRMKMMKKECEMEKK